MVVVDGAVVDTGRDVVVLGNVVVVTTEVEVVSAADLDVGLGSVTPAHPATIRMADSKARRHRIGAGSVSKDANPVADPWYHRGVLIHRWMVRHRTPRR